MQLVFNIIMNKLHSRSRFFILYSKHKLQVYAKERVVLSDCCSEISLYQLHFQHTDTAIAAIHMQYLHAHASMWMQQSFHTY